MDIYEIAPVTGAALSVKKTLGLNSHEKCHVHVQGSGKSENDSSHLSAGASSLMHQNSVTTNAINGMGSGTPPCGMYKSSSPSLSLSLLDPLVVCTYPYHHH
jgi:hypothetical protein